MKYPPADNYSLHKTASRMPAALILVPEGNSTD
jgi:hypothetical protein